MGKQRYTKAVTPFAELREMYNETHDKTISQSYMGTLAHVSKSTISRIENREQKPTPEATKAYSDFLM